MKKMNGHPSIGKEEKRTVARVSGPRRAGPLDEETAADIASLGRKRRGTHRELLFSAFCVRNEPTLRRLASGAVSYWAWPVLFFTFSSGSLDLGGFACFDRCFSPKYRSSGKKHLRKFQKFRLVFTMIDREKTFLI
jgi:hypothetical protein